MPATQPLLIEATRLFDGSAAQSATTLLVQDGAIKQVGGAVPEGVQRLIFDNATILPGLIDCHVHLCFDATATPAENLAERDDEQALAQMAEAAQTALHAGVTTVRDLGSRGDLIFRLREQLNATDGPHILAAGRPLTIPSGHCWFLGGIAEDESMFLDLLRHEIDRGADVIKIMATGGAMTPSSDPSRPQFAPEVLKRAVYLAHSLGRPVAAHALSRGGIQDALAAGVDTLEHGTFLGDDGAHVHAADVELMRTTRTVLTPTLATVAARCTVPGATGGRLAPDVSAADFWERRRRDVGRLIYAGARVIAGSDCGVAHVPHHAVIDEVECLAATSLAPAAALRAATGFAADTLRLASVTGQLKPGLRADILVVEGDPLADLSALRRPLAVFKAGQRIR
ncbi:MAG TPA: amidohydrolase family protein [Chloroflexota bacterium]|nr:amidohydrolase family protein [Chloroflexota bacterium]